MRRTEGAHELMDGPLSEADLTACLDDLDRLNRWFGGYALSLARLRAAVASVPRARTLLVVDAGGGRGDFALRVMRWARRHHRTVRVVVVDRDAASVARARYPEIMTVVGDVTALPIREDGADVVTLSLTLHHLEPDEAVTALGEMAAVARHGVIVNDLWRGYLSLALVWLGTRVLGLHPVSRHDGPLSVRRSYSGAEVRALAEKAGLRRITIRAYPLLARLVAVLS